MNLPILRDVAASPLGVPLSLFTEQGAGSVEIYHSVTSDGPDGQPWPPPDNNTLWVIVRRADGCTRWRSIQLLKSARRPCAPGDSSHQMEASNSDRA